MPNPNNSPENLVNCKYYDISQVKNLKTCDDNKSLSLFHLNTRSLPKNFFQLFDQSTNIDFDIIAISESSIIKNKPPIVDIKLPNYSYEFCPMESSAGGTLLYIRNYVSYILRKGTSIYKSYELDSTFIEIDNPKRLTLLSDYLQASRNES